MMILAFAVTIVALSFGLLNDSGEYLSVEGDSAAFFAHLVAQIWNCCATCSLETVVFITKQRGMSGKYRT